MTQEVPGTDLSLMGQVCTGYLLIAHFRAAPRYMYPANFVPCGR